MRCRIATEPAPELTRPDRPPSSAPPFQKRATSGLVATKGQKQKRTESRGPRNQQPLSLFRNIVHVSPTSKPSMTSLVGTRQPLQILSMTNQPERRHSKRLAGEYICVPQHFFRCIDSHCSDCEDWLTRSMDVAASVYDEKDGDFHFTRGSKRLKTSASEQDPIPGPATAAGRKGAGRSSKNNKTRTSPPPPAQSQLQTTTTTRPPRRRASPAGSPDQDESLAVSKTRSTRRRTRASVDKSHEEEATSRTNGTRASASVDDRVGVIGGTPVHIQDATGQGHGSKKIALPFSDTPIINRNKELRKKGAAGGRRSSLGMRGRRASSLIENGHSAIPHRDVETAEFYKHIEAEGLSEPRRMRQLLTWCGERALSEKPPHGSSNSNAILGGRSNIALGV